MNMLKKRLQNRIIWVEANFNMERSWSVGHNKSIYLGKTAVLMGILNVTPDSFSDGGEHSSLQDAISHAQKMFSEGAKIIDIGGESTRPGFDEITLKDEQERVLPVVKQLNLMENVLLSIDTYHVETARLALMEGANIINDIWGLQKEPEMAALVAEERAGIIIMHNSRHRNIHPDIIEDQKFFFDKSLEIAKKSGIPDDNIVLDPGFGFGKDFRTNLALLDRASELAMFGFPMLAATSRKRFLGTITGHSEPKMRDIATSATSVLLRKAGFSIFRVHNIAANRDALAVVDALSDVENSVIEGKK